MLVPEQRHEAFYRTVEDNRRAMYARIGLNLQAAHGRGSWSGSLLPPAEGLELIRYPAVAIPPATLLHGYSSFMLRSVEQDEQFVLNAMSRFRPRRLDFNPHQSSYGGAYLYPLSGVFAALHVVGGVRLVSDPIYYYRNPDELAKLYKAGRLFSAAACLGCVVLVFLIGRHLYGEKVGLWGAAIFGLAPAVNAFAHVMKPHLPGSFWALWCLLCCLRAMDSKKPAELVKASVFFGLAVGCVKYFWALGFAIFIAYYLMRRAKGALGSLAELAGLGALSVAVFFLTNPYTLFNWTDFMDEMRGMTRWYQPELTWRGVWNFIWVPLRVGLGAGPWLAGLAGLAYAFYRRAPSDRKALLLFVPLFLATAFQTGASSSSPLTIRFFFPGAALLTLIGVEWVSKAAAARLPRGLSTAALCLLLGANVAGAALYDANFLADARGRSHSFEAGRWIERHIPPGSSLGFGTPAPMLDRFPPLPFARYEMVYFNGPLAGQDERRLPKYYITNARWTDGLPADFLERYKLEKTFSSSRQDLFTAANFPVAVFVRK